MSLTSSSYFLNSALVLCWVQRCENTLLLILSSKLSPCWMMLSANPSSLKGYWKDTSAGSQFQSRILRSTVILTLPEMKEKSSTRVWVFQLRAKSQQYLFLLPFTCFPTSSTSDLKAQIFYIQIINITYHHHMKLLFIAIVLLWANLLLALPDPTYTIHYVRSYRRDLIENYFGCGKSIVYGTYLHPLGTVDALFALTNSHIYGFNSNCQRKDTYIKIFGQAQDYQLLTINTINIIDQISQAVSRTSVRKIILDWKYLPEEGKRGAARDTLQQLAVGLEKKGFTVFVKAPASYFCLIVSNRKYILDLPIKNLIVELYGEEPGRYVTYDSVFGSVQSTADTGYTSDCPKYPTQRMLQSRDKKIYFQKTLDSTKSGFVKSSTWQSFLQKAGQDKFNSIYFYDGYPEQTVDL